MKAASIRSLLLMLVLALSVPLVALIAYEIYEHKQEDVAHTKSSLRTLATTMAGNTGRKIANAKLTLESLAKRPLVRQLDADHCDGILQELLTLNADYANVAYTNRAGRVVCSALPMPGNKAIFVGNEPAYQDFLKEQRFYVGRPVLGPITKKWVSVLSAPVWNDQHELVGGVHIPMNIEAFDPKIPTQYLPPGSRHGFFRDDGIMVWRNLDPEGVIGQRPNAEAARRILEVRDGEFESLAVDDVTRFFSVVPMPDVGWVAFVGVPVAAVYADANRRALVGAILGLVSITLLVLLSVAIARRIAGPMMALADIARSVQGGDRTAQAATQGPREVVEVAYAFNAMTESLRASNRALETEIAERRQMEGQVRDMAFHDPLTKLANRLLLSDRLGQAMAAGVRSGFYGALLFLDLDHFKPLNDTHGHEAGDLLLIEVAQRLTSCVRQMDTVVRFGGDEFVVVLSDLHTDLAMSRAQAQAIAEKIRALLSAPYQLSVQHEGQPAVSVEHRCSASIGVALFVDHAISQADILKLADAAMYEAKKAGGNTIRFAPDVD